MKTRILSAVVIIIIAIIVVATGGLLYNLTSFILMGLAFKEIINLKAFKDLPNMVKIIAFLTYFGLFIEVFASSSFNGIYFPLCMGILVNILPSIFCDEEDYSISKGFYLSGILILIALSISSIYLIGKEPLVLLYLLSITVIGDSTAMLFGKKFGKHKLCPVVSPNKTVEGSIAGLVSALLGSVLVYFYLLGEITISVFAISLLLCVFSQIGDLIFSKIKRENETKDFSDLIPGHGGLLDRLDSLFIVSLVYMIISIYF